MSLRRYLSTNRKAEADQSSLGKDGTPTSTYSSNVMTAPSHSLSGRDSVGQPDETVTESSLTDTIGISEKSTAATPDYIYYHIYAEDGSIPSKTLVTADDPFLGRIKARSVPPPRTAKTVKRSIAKVENIKDRESTSLFLTRYSQSPMDDAGKVILNGTGPGSTPQEPLALVAKMSDSNRSALESDGRGELASPAEPDTMSPKIQYLYYLLYNIDYEMPSKVAFDPEESSLGRIRADSVAPPHSSTSIKRCISRVEANPALAWHADLFADTSCDIPLKEGHISIRCSPSLSPNEPMAIVLRQPIPDGKYFIKNRAKDIYWSAANNPLKTVYFYLTTVEWAESADYLQWDITNYTNGNISIRSVYAPYSPWVGGDMTGSKVPVPWLLIPADTSSKFHYLTTDLNHFSRNRRVPMAQDSKDNYMNDPGSMATLKEGDQWQMWEFIPV